jgi:hypothetical protein
VDGKRVVDEGYVLPTEAKFIRCANLESEVICDGFIFFVYFVLFSDVFCLCCFSAFKQVLWGKGAKTTLPLVGVETWTAAACSNVQHIKSFPYPGMLHKNSFFALIFSVPLNRYLRKGVSPLFSLQTTLPKCIVCDGAGGGKERLT